MANRIFSVFRQLGPKLLLRGLVLIAILVGAALLLERYRFEEILDLLAFSDGRDTGWLHGKAAYLGVAALFTAVGGPRQAVSFFGAYFFGLGAGFALALAGTAIGCLIAYYFARGFREAADSIIHGRVALARQIWIRNAFSVTLITRLMPVGSNLLGNLAAGVAGVPIARFFLGSVAGYVPQTLVFALMGSGINVGSAAQIAISVALFVASTALGIWIYARYRRQLNLAGGSADEEAG